MATNSHLIERRTQLNIWLASKNMSRKELADACNVSEATVYGWLSNTNISDKRWQELKTLFETNEPPPEHLPITLSFTDEEWEALTAHLPPDCDKVEVLKQQMLAIISALKLPNQDA